MKEAASIMNFLAKVAIRRPMILSEWDHKDTLEISINCTASFSKLFEAECIMISFEKGQADKMKVLSLAKIAYDIVRTLEEAKEYFEQTLNDYKMTGEDGKIAVPFFGYIKMM
jgi:hypothetical protein